MKLLSLVLIVWGISAAQAQSPVRKVRGTYRMKQETRSGLSVWIVDGPKVRAYIDSEFLYGGNQERYLYNPVGEIWIDNSISCQEYSYTLAHELYEERLMSTRGFTYDDAHDSALSLEYRMRLSDQAEAKAHEAKLPLVPPIDDDSTKEISSLPALLRLENIYLQHVGSREGMEIWIVDGPAVRRNIFPDFGFSGNDLAYLFIPAHEIWLDNSMSCEEMEFAIQTEIGERAMIAQGRTYYDAYTMMNKRVGALRRKIYLEAELHPPVRIAGELHREVGTGHAR